MAEGSALASRWQDLIGLVLFSAFVVGTFAAMLVAAHFLGRIAARRGEAVKGEPFECGYPARAPLPERAPVTFYIVGLLLLVFDVEVVFLYPWAAEFRALGATGFVEMLAFIGMLGAGYVYILRRGAFRW